MDVSIEFAEPNMTYTNGDIIHGDVVVYSKKSITVSSITVTFSGKSTWALSETSGSLLQRKTHESHKILHVTGDLALSLDNPKSAKQATARLSFGYHRFPFSLKIPWVGGCETCPDSTSRELPPSMSDLGKDAEVLYKLDAFVTVRNMFKGTFTKSARINVWPLDTRSVSGVYTSPTAFPCTKSVVTTIGGLSCTASSCNQGGYLISLSPTTDSARILVEARFPHDYSLTCGEDVAMNISVEKLDAYPDSLYLQSFQILLVGYTDISRQGSSRGPKTFWMIQSLSNINHQVGNGEYPAGTKTTVDKGLWEGKPLSKSVIPSFKSCNVERRYELEISMGFRSEAPRGRIKLVQLCIPVRVCSGILPGQRKTGGEDYRMTHCVGLDPIQVNADREGPSLLYPASSIGEHGFPASPPPSYTDAILTSVNDGLRREGAMVGGRL